MAASMIHNMTFCRLRCFIILTSKMRYRSSYKSHFSEFHSSPYLLRRRPFRRKQFEVFLPQDNHTDSTKGSVTVNVSQTSITKSTESLPSDTQFLKRREQNVKRESSIISVSRPTNSSEQVYSKASSDKRFSNAMALAKNRKLRDRSNQVVLEGYRLIKDALMAGARCHILFFSMVSNLDGLPIDRGETELVKIPYREIELWSDLATPQGIIGIFKKPPHPATREDESDPCIPLTLVCDNIRDPGNLGTILRAAAAANCEQILLTKGCVDIWDQKVLRAAAGAHFHMPITGRVTWTDVLNHIGSDVALHIADTEKGTQKDHPSEDPLVQMPHSKLDWCNQSALVIGGETEGISQEATELSERTHGMRIYIPMSRAIDSLNAAMSTTVLLFEAKRQWLLHQQREEQP